VSNVISIFSYESYKKFLRDIIQNSSKRGIIKELAHAATVHRPYLSKVLNDKVHLLPDQLFGISSYLELSEEETGYLLLLLELDRSDKSSYKKFVEKKLKEIRLAEEEKNKAIGKANIVASLDESAWLYYSHWLYPVVHISVSTPSLQKIENLARALNQRPDRIHQILMQLQKMGFVRKQNDLWIWNQGSWHTSKLDSRSLMFHKNLRDYTFEQVSLKMDRGVSFSATQSISSSDYKKLHQSIMSWITHFNKVATPSNPEVPVVLCCDFFSVEA